MNKSIRIPVSCRISDEIKNVLSPSKKYNKEERKEKGNQVLEKL